MRLDMAKVYGGTLGNPEETMRRALKTVEAVAPVILWIEEIEKGVAGYAQGDAGVTARIFSSFLTWMQEKTSLVFIAATANEIDKLPPELLRKGRFDEIFFVDLPTEKERMEIFKVHIVKRTHNPEKFNLVNLSKATNNFSGAEIEQIVAAGMFEAFNEKRQFNDHDLYKMIAKTVPLSTTMSERIKEIKRWADTRAVRATKN
jgi:SpoVK/Ycf46/Vps4 family AAA+-type ATPase